MFSLLTFQGENFSKEELTRKPTEPKTAHHTTTGGRMGARTGEGRNDVDHREIDGLVIRPIGVV